VHELARDFRTRRGSIYRDLRVLQDAGYAIAGDERCRLSRPGLLASPIPDVSFSADELKALVVAATQVRPALPDENSLGTAILKVKAIGKSVSNSIPLGFEGMFES
jgi:predicted DNA-binding transcriptional regulator YafY